MSSVAVVRVRLVVWFAVWAALATGLCAQGEERPAGLDVESVAARLAAVKEAPEIAEGERAAAVDSYTKALDAIRAGDTLAAEAAALRTFRESLTARLAEAKQVHARPVVTANPEPANGATLADLERAAAGADDAAKAAARELERAEARIQTRAQRQPLLPQLTAAARGQLADVESQLAKLTLADPPKPSGEARRVELQARRYQAAARVRALDAELQSYDGSEELLTIERDIAQRRSAAAAELVRAWQTLVQRKREDDARQAAADAARAVAAAEDQNPLLARLAHENEALARRRGDLAAELARVTRAQERSGKRLADIDRDLQDLSTRVDTMPGSDTLGALLRDRRASLPDVRTLRARVAEERQKRDAQQLERFEFDDARRLLRSPGYLQEVLQAADPPVPATDASTQSKAGQLLEARLETINQLIKDSGALFDAWIKLEDSELALLAKIRQFVEFVNEHVLWTPSTTPLWRMRFDGGVSSSWSPFDASNWTQLWAAIQRDWSERAPGLLLVLAVIALLANSTRRVRRSLAEQGEVAARGTCFEFRPTMLAIWLTALLALPIPAAMWGIGWRLELSSNPTDFAHTVANGLQLAAWLLLALGFLRHVVRPGGLAESHFTWPTTALRPFRTNLWWATPVVVVGVFLSVVLEQSGSRTWSEGLGRPVLLVMMLALATFFWRVLHPRAGVGSMSRRGTVVDGWSSRLRVLWFLLGVGIPVALFVLGVLGYHFTALQLAVRLGATAGVLVALFLVNDVILRALVVERRRLGMRQAAEKRRAAALKAGEAGAQNVAVEEPLIDVTSIADQTHRLLRSLLTLGVVFGAWLIWVDVLPALRVFRDVKLWEEISLAEAMFAGIVFVMTFLAARNIPGVLHLTVLQRLQVHEGERHAIATIARYLIILVGVIYGFSMLGLGWGKLQWLAAGISVGLGFGLQEVFANFVSGLIILFERPIRVGDLVTVGGIDGYVSRIQMRATTIRDYNRKELIIPNKEFITGSVVNWTLSDALTRLVIKVGVAYGSDTALAKAILLQVAAEERHILSDPRPKAWFLSFGESSLDFELRVFINNLDNWPAVLDSVHRRIDDEFRKAGIEIAFPQRDLHIRSAKPLVDALRPREPRASEDA